MARQKFTPKSDTLIVQKHGYRKLWVTVFFATLAALACVRYVAGFHASLAVSALVFGIALILFLLEKSKK